MRWISKLGRLAQFGAAVTVLAGTFWIAGCEYDDYDRDWGSRRYYDRDDWRWRHHDHDWDRDQGHWRHHWYRD